MKTEELKEIKKYIDLLMEEVREANEISIQQRSAQHSDIIHNIQNETKLLKDNMTKIVDILTTLIQKI